MDLVDQRGLAVGDPVTPAAVGRQHPQVRMVSALPLLGAGIVRPLFVERASALIGNSVAVVASPRAYVHRMVWAGRD